MRKMCTISALCVQGLFYEYRILHFSYGVNFTHMVGINVTSMFITYMLVNDDKSCLLMFSICKHFEAKCFIFKIIHIKGTVDPKMKILP